MTIDGASAGHAIPASSNRSVNAPQIRKSRSGSRGSTGFVPESVWILHCKQQFGLL